MGNRGRNRRVIAALSARNAEIRPAMRSRCDGCEGSGMSEKTGRAGEDSPVPDPARTRASRRHPSGSRGGRRILRRRGGMLYRARSRRTRDTTLDRIRRCGPEAPSGVARGGGRGGSRAGRSGRLHRRRPCRPGVVSPVVQGRGDSALSSAAAGSDLDAVHCAQEKSRMASLAQRLGGDALGWDALQPE